MPSTATITAFYNFTASTKIKSAEHNANFSNFRGHLIPIDPNTATAATTRTYDLGSSDYNWRHLYNQNFYTYQNTSTALPSNPSSGYLAFYSKTNGFFYQKDSSGNEYQVSIYRDPTIQKFTSGSGTYTTPAGVKYIIVEMVGGGGGGGGSGTASFGASGAGGGTSFGTSLLSCNGGSGGGQSGNSAGGAVTVNSPATNILSFDGQNGGGAQYDSTADSQLMGGTGADTLLGIGGAGGAYGQVGTTVRGYGAGGGGAGRAGIAGAYTGGGGGAGGYIKALITSPSASYSYAVGAAGTAGTAGTSGANGSAGGSGVIIVTEYYA